MEQQTSGRWRVAAQSADWRRCPVGAGSEGRVPTAYRAGVQKGRASELEGGGMRILTGADIVPIEDELSEVRVPVRSGRRQVCRGEFLGCRMGVGVERRLAVAGVAR